MMMMMTILLMSVTDIDKIDIHRDVDVLFFVKAERGDLLVVIVLYIKQKLCMSLKSSRERENLNERDKIKNINVLVVSSFIFSSSERENLHEDQLAVVFVALVKAVGRLVASDHRHLHHHHRRHHHRH